MNEDEWEAPERLSTTHRGTLSSLHRKQPPGSTPLSHGLTSNDTITTGIL